MPCCSAARARLKIADARIARQKAVAAAKKAQITGVTPKKVPAKKVAAKKAKPCTLCGKFKGK